MAINAAELQITVTADASQAKSELSGVEGMLSGVLIGHQVKDFGEGIMDFVSDFVMVGAVFEEQMTVVDRIIGGTISHLEELKKKAVEADINTMFDPFEVAKGMEMLARSGFDAMQIIGTPGQQDGLIDSLLFFAAATRTDVESAGRSFAATMRIFENSGMTSIEIADLLTAAILRSGKSTDQFMTAFQYVGAISQQFGTAPEEIATAVALLEQLGIRSMSVGTGLRSMYDGFATNADAIAAAGVSIYDFDAAGNKVLKTLPDIIQQFHALSKSMDPDAFYTLIEGIFGKPAASPLVTLFTTGAENWDRFVQDMEEVGSAEEMMEARMNTLMGSIEKLKATWLGFKKVLGDSVSEYIKPIIDGLTGMINAMQSFPAPVLKVIAGVIALTGVLATLTGSLIILRAVGGTSAIGAVLKQIVGIFLPISMAKGTTNANLFIRMLTFMLRLFSPIRLAMYALSAAIAIVSTNFGGARDALMNFGDHLKNLLANFQDVYSFLRLDGRGPLEAFIRAVGGGLAKELGLSGDKMTKFYDAVKRIADKAVDFDRGLGFIKRGISGISDAFKEGGLDAGFEELFGRGGERILNGLGKILGTLPDVLGQLLVELDWGPTLDPMMAEIGRMAQRFGNAVEAAFAGDWSRAWENVKRGARRGARAGILLWGVLVKIGSWAVEFGRDLWSAIKEKFNLLFGGNDFVSGQGPDGGFNNSGQFVSIGSLLVKIKDFTVQAWDGSLLEGVWDEIVHLLTSPDLFTSQDMAASEDIGRNIGLKLGELFAKGIEAAGKFIGNMFFGDESQAKEIYDPLSGKMRASHQYEYFDVVDLLESFLAGFFGGFDDGADEVFAPYKAKVSEWWDRTWNSLLDLFGGVESGSSQAAKSRFTTKERDFSFINIIKGILKLDEWVPENLSFPDLGGPIGNWLQGEINEARAAFSRMAPDWIRLLANGDFVGSMKALFGGAGSSTSMGDAWMNAGQVWNEMANADNVWFDDLGNRRTGPEPIPVSGPGAVPGADPRPTQGPPAPSTSAVRASFVAPISSATAQAGTVLSTFVTRSPTILSPLASALQRKAQEGMNSFNLGINTGMNSAVQFAIIGRNRIIAAVQLPSLYHHGFVTGQSLGSGLAAGIISTLQQVINARNQLISAGSSAPAPAPEAPRGPGFLPLSNGGTVINQTNNIAMSASEVEEFVNATNFVANLDRSRQIILGTV